MGCSTKTEIEDRDFCMAIGIDLADDKFSVSYVFPNLDELTGQSTKDKENLTFETTAESIYEAELKFTYLASKKLDFSHLKVLILGEKVISNEEKIKEILKYIEDNSIYSRNTLVFIAPNQASEIIKLDQKIQGSIGNYLNDLYTNNRKGSNTENATLGDLINNINNKDRAMGIPLVVNKEEKPAIDGEAVVQNGKLVKFVDNLQYTYLIMAKGQGEESSIIVDENCTIKLENIKKKYTFNMKDNNPNLKIKLTGSAVIIDGKVSREEEKKEQRLKVNDFLKNNVTQALLYVKEDEGVDYLNSFELLGIKNRNMWLQYKDKKDEFYSEITIEVYVDLEVR